MTYVAQNRAILESPKINIPLDALGETFRYLSQEYNPPSIGV